LSIDLAFTAVFVGALILRSIAFSLWPNGTSGKQLKLAPVGRGVFR
jgi:hypothetical protein